MDDKCQTMDAVYVISLHQSRKKGKWKKGVIIIHSHSTIKDIHMKQHLSYVWHLKKT